MPGEREREREREGGREREGRREGGRERASERARERETLESLLFYVVFRGYKKESPLKVTSPTNFFLS